MSAVEEATAEAAKHGDRSSEQLTALVAEARVMIEQARAVKAGRARAAAEEAEAAAAVEAVERLKMEEELAALTLRAQQVQAQLGSSVAPPAAPEETQCVVCMDAPKDCIVLPCMHMCVCEACAQLLRDRCPVCRGPIERIAQLFT